MATPQFIPMDWGPPAEWDDDFEDNHSLAASWDSGWAHTDSSSSFDITQDEPADVLESTRPPRYKQYADELVLFEAVAHSLLRGSHNRSPLPMELVLYIMKLAECIVVEPSLDILEVRRSPISLKPREIPLEMTVFMVTKPMTRAIISRTAGLHLRTFSRNQGWIEIGLYKSHAEGTPRYSSNGTELSWLTHNIVDHSPLFYWYSSEMFIDPGHEMWSHIEEGDCIGVRLGAANTGRSFRTKRALVQFWRWYEPVLPLTVTQRTGVLTSAKRSHKVKSGWFRRIVNSLFRRHRHRY